jgi:PAS domain S-box-containing protein
MTSAIRVLYAEDNPLDAELTRTRFAEGAPDVELEFVDSGQGCLDRLRGGGFDLLLLDHRLPDMDGLDVLRALVHGGERIPVVLVTGSGDEDLVVRALRLGAASYVPKAGDYLEGLPEHLRQVVAEHRTRTGQRSNLDEPRRVLYVEHQSMDIDLTLRHFAEVAPLIEMQVVRSCAEALERLRRQEACDAALIDLRMPDMSGLDFVREAKRRGLRLPPFIVISGRGDERAAIASLQLGAADYVTKTEGYLDDLRHALCRAIARDRLDRMNARLQADLEERSRDQAAIEERRLFLDTLLNVMPVAVFYKDTEGRYLGVNQAFARYFGRSREEVVGKTIFDLAPRDEAQAHDATDREILASPGVRVYEARTDGPDGRSHEMIFHKASYADAAGRTAGLVGVVMDVTEQKRAAEALRLQNVIMATQQETTKDGILIVDIAGRILLCNRRFAEMWGLPRADLAGASDESTLAAVTGQMADPEGFLRRVQWLYANPEERSEDELLLKDGRVFERYSAPMRSTEGMHFGRVWYFRDVTARRQVEQEVAAQLDELRRWHEASLGREGRMLELKHEVNELLARAGLPRRYEADEPGGGG